MSVTIHISVEEMAKHEAQLRAEFIREQRETLDKIANIVNRRLAEPGDKDETETLVRIGTVVDAYLSPPSSWPTNEAESEAEANVHSATCPRCFLSFTCTGDTRPSPAANTEGLRDYIGSASASPPPSEPSLRDAICVILDDMVIDYQEVDGERESYGHYASRICALFEGARGLAVSTRMVLHCAGEAVAYWLEAIEDGGEALDAAMEKLADALKDDAKYRLTHGVLDRSEPLCACGKERDHPLHSPINTSGHRYNPTALTRPAPADALREDHL